MAESTGRPMPRAPDWIRAHESVLLSCAAAVGGEGNAKSSRRIRQVSPNWLRHTRTAESPGDRRATVVPCVRTRRASYATRTGALKGDRVASGAKPIGRLREPFGNPGITHGPAAGAVVSRAHPECKRTIAHVRRVEHRGNVASSDDRLAELPGRAFGTRGAHGQASQNRSSEVTTSTIAMAARTGHRMAPVTAPRLNIRRRRNRRHQPPTCLPAAVRNAEKYFEQEPHVNLPVCEVERLPRVD